MKALRQFLFNETAKILMLFWDFTALFEGHTGPGRAIRLRCFVQGLLKKRLLVLLECWKRAVLPTLTRCA